MLLLVRKCYVFNNISCSEAELKASVRSLEISNPKTPLRYRPPGPEPRLLAGNPGSNKFFTMYIPTWGFKIALKIITFEYVTLSTNYFTMLIVFGT